MKAKTYITVYINSKSDLPKEKGTYFCNKSGFDTVMTLDPDLPEKSYQREVRWYLKPVETPLSNEMSDEEIFVLFNKYSNCLSRFPVKMLAMTRSAFIDAIKEYTLRFNATSQVSDTGKKYSDSDRQMMDGSH